MLSSMNKQTEIMISNGTNKALHDGKQYVTMMSFVESTRKRKCSFRAAALGAAVP